MSLPANAALVGPPSRSKRLQWLLPYFASGWQFLVPYLGLYLLYTWQHWPVNPGTGPAPVPSLYTLFWGLHLGHLLLLGLAAYSHAHLLAKIGSGWFGLVPWVLIGSLIAVPGIYWEYPNDTWEHVLRIANWWSSTEVMSNSDWRKASYFFAYTLVRPMTPGGQAFALEVYHTGAALLLCWQYYRLARDLALSAPAALLCVLLQLLLAGNNIFAFDRYYGIASTVPAQVAALAFIRLSLRLAKTPAGLTWVGGLVQASLLVALMAFNHVQALALALTGLGAVVVWRLREWRRASTWWFAMIGILTSFALAAWWSSWSTHLGPLREQGWLGAWYGFNLAPGSPSLERIIEILGIFGLVNAAAGFALLRRNHAAGWLTILPLLGLVLPLTALPLAESLARQSYIHIIVFHRVLLAIPTGLALVALAEAWLQQTEKTRGHDFSIALLPIGLLLLLLLPAGTPAYNRFWHAIMVPPADLAMRQVKADLGDPEMRTRFKSSPHFATQPAAGFVAAASGWRSPTTFGNRLINFPVITRPARSIDLLENYLAGGRSQPLVLFAHSFSSMHTPFSQAGYLSGSWLSQEVVLGTAGEAELRATAHAQTTKEFHSPAGCFYLFGPR